MKTPEATKNLHNPCQPPASELGAHIGMVKGELAHLRAGFWISTIFGPPSTITNSDHNSEWESCYRALHTQSICLFMGGGLNLWYALEARLKPLEKACEELMEAGSTQPCPCPPIFRKMHRSHIPWIPITPPSERTLNRSDYCFSTGPRKDNPDVDRMQCNSTCWLRNYCNDASSPELLQRRLTCVIAITTPNASQNPQSYHTTKLDPLHDSSTS